MSVHAETTSERPRSRKHRLAKVAFWTAGVLAALPVGWTVLDLAAGGIDPANQGVTDDGRPDAMIDQQVLEATEDHVEDMVTPFVVAEGLAVVSLAAGVALSRKASTPPTEAQAMPVAA